MSAIMSGWVSSKWLAAAEVTRRAFLSSKSNTAAGQIETKWACQQLVYMVQKNEDISTFVISIDRGAIFPPRSSHDLSRNVVGVAVYAF